MTAVIQIPDAVRAALQGVPPGARVAVGMSGGVDSSVAAMLLCAAGFDVIGLTMRIWDGSLAMADEGRSGCFGPGEERDIETAQSVARRLGIPHRVVSLTGDYRREVLDYYRSEYLAGRTPNPCVRCNRRIKFGALLEHARAERVAFDWFATGHYARRSVDPTGRPRLLRAVDRAKDQSYFLCQLAPAQLAATLLPLGGLRKAEVRALAAAAGFPELAARAESQDFIESRDHGPLFEAGEAAPGDIVDMDGRVLGRHPGVIHFTVGQRKGLGIGGAGEPWYVVAIEPAPRRVIVGRREHLAGRRLRAVDMNWIAWDAPPAEAFRAEGQVRARHAAAPATARAGPAGDVEVEFDEPQFAIAPGQIAALFDRDTVLGGGTIATP